MSECDGRQATGNQDQVKTYDWWLVIGGVEPERKTLAAALQSIKQKTFRLSPDFPDFPDFKMPRTRFAAF